MDGVIWDTPEKKAMAVATLRQHGYRRVAVTPGLYPQKWRNGTTSALDSVYERPGHAGPVPAGLDPIAETLADPNSYGFRLERSTADAIDQCHRVLSQRWSAQWILEGDIRSCFDSISHDWLLANIPMDKAILRNG